MNNQVTELNSSKLRVSSMKVISYDALLVIYMKVRFNRQIKVVDEELIDEIPRAFTLAMRSEVDDS